ncbi:MAG: DUF1761 domain-containing protein [Albidovulum sp.]
MGLLSVIAAAAAAWVFGAAYFAVLAKPWTAASGLSPDALEQPAAGTNPLPFVLSALAMLLVAGMMRHIFSTAGIAGFGSGAVAGLGIGLFFIAPWIMMNNAYARRPFRLTLIDGGYAVAGAAIIGGVLTLI